jgi:hypothetical protein
VSLTVSPHLQEQAAHGAIDDHEFVECIRTSLPYAWQVVSGLAAELDAGGQEFADNLAPPPDEQARGQLLRMLASDAMRGALQRHFGVGLAFQNCHRVAVFRPSAIGSRTHREFVSARAQILNQSPELRNC